MRVVFNLGPEVAGLNVPHQSRLWAMRPHFSGTIRRGKHDVTTNRLGFRSPEVREGAPRNWARILLLGDSVSFGYAVKEKDSWGRFLERLLNENDERDVEVINTGHLGYSTWQEAAVLRQFGTLLEPDMILIQFYPNDPLENYTYRELSKLQMLLPRSALYNLLRGAYLYLRGAKDYRLFEDPTRGREVFAEAIRLAEDELDMQFEEAIFSGNNPDLLAGCWRKTSEAVEEIATLARELNAPVRGVVFPSMNQAYGVTASTVFQDSLAAICERHGVRLIDLLPSFSGRMSLYKGLHPSVEGNAEAAAVVRDVIAPELDRIPAAGN